MAHLDDVKLVCIERFAGEDVEAGRSSSRSAARHPAGRTTDNKSHNSRGGNHRRPRPSIGSVVLKHLVELEPLRYRFFGDGAVARADALGLRPPGRDQRGLFGMIGKPRGDDFPAVGRQFAVDIGVQFILGHG